MIRKLFEHRSNRVIAACRVALALLFGLWVWIDPDQPARNVAAGYILMGLYVAYAVALFPVAWNDWWLDFRLAVPAYLVDAAIFVSALAFTQAGRSDFVSAHFAFFTFLTLSCALRWNWRTTLASTLLLAFCYVAVGTHLSGGATLDQIARFVRRASYMFAVSLIVTWFALQRSTPRVGQFSFAPAARTASPYEAALAYAIGATGASGAALAWESAEEPGCTLQLAGSLVGGGRHIPPGELDLAADRDPCLFDRERQRCLRLGGGRTVAARLDEGPRLASYLGLPSGLAVPLAGNSGIGQLVLVGISGLSREHLSLGKALAREIAHGLDEEEIASLARETAAMRLRGNIARDLHDSVAQSLAGVAYRLAGLRQSASAGKDVLPEIDAIRESLGEEQAHVRDIIARLRSDAVQPGTRDLGTEIERLVGALARHWQVEVRVEDCEPLVISAWLVFEIQQIVREGIANAVRHGAARHVGISCERGAGGLALAITDDGTGFPPGADARLPQSIAERVAALGGRMNLAREGGKTRIEITLPLGGRP